MTSSATPSPLEVLEGERVMRVGWLPGSDRLRGRCHCGAEAEGEDPVGMWEWLLAHPAHPAAGPGEQVPRQLPPPAHLVRDPALIHRRAPAGRTER